MNKLFSKIAALSVGLAMAIGVGVAVGSRSARVARADSVAEFTLSGASDVEVDGVTASFAKGSGSSAPAWYANGLRLYVSNTITISSESTITGVTFNWEQQGTKTFNTVTANVGNYTHPSSAGVGTWSGEANEIVFTCGTKSKAQLQLNTFSVAYSGGEDLGNLVSLSISGSMTKVSYTTSDSAWDPTGFTITGIYEHGSKEVTSNVNWSYDPSVPTAGTTSVEVTATLGEVSESVDQAVTVSEEYSIAYNANDSASRSASGIPSTVTGLLNGDTVALTGAPTRWGYTFAGWATSDSSTTPVSSITIDGADVNVYAIWQENHSVSGAWSDSPYSIAQAKAAIDANTNLKDVYVGGTISQIDQYYGNYHSITYWISDDGTTTNQFEVYSGKGLNGANFNAITDIEVGADVVINGDIKKYNSVYEFDKTSKQIFYDAPSTGDIEVTFQPSSFLGVGDSGTYTASTEAANPSYSFSSDNSSVLSVSSNGAFSAVAAGSATVRVDVTSSDGSGYKEVAVTVVAVKSVSEAYEIAEDLASGATTDYSIKVTGYLSDFDADGKARAVNLTDGEKVIMAFFGGGNADYTTVVSSGVIGSKVTLFAKVQNYSGTYELKDITLGVIAQGDANSYAAGAFAYLDGSCETGPAAVTEDQWTTAKNGFDALDPEEQAEFKEEELSGNVEKWVGRYTRIVSNTELENFMSLDGIVRRNQYPFDLKNNPTIFIVIAIATASTLAFTLLLVFKKRKHN